MREDLHGAASRVVGGTGDDPHPYLPGGREDQGRFEGEFLDGGGTDAAARRQGEVQVGRRRYDDRAEHGVVGQPGLRPQGPPAGEDDLAGAGEVDLGSEQRVISGGEPGGRQVQPARGGPKVQPVALPLEGVRRQVHRPAGREQGAQVHVHAPHEQPGQRGDERLLRLTVPPRHGHDQGVVRALVGEGLLGDAREGRAGAHVEEDVRAGLAGAPYRVVEADGFAHVAHPVRDGRQLPGSGLTAQQGRDDGDLRGAAAEFAEGRREGVQDGVHERGVEGVTDGEQFRGGSGGDQPVTHRVDLVADARDDDRRGTVDGGDAHPVVRGEQGPYLVLRCAYGQHGAGLLDGLHDSAAGGHEPGGTVQVEGAADVGGGDLADRVTDQQARRRAVARDQAVQGDLEGEQRRLGDVGAVGEVVGGPAGQQQGLEGEGQVRVEAGTHLVEAPGEDREGVVQLSRRAGPAGALPGEQEDGAVGLPGDPAHHVRGFGALAQRRETAQQVVPLMTKHHRAVLEPGAGRRQRPSDGSDVGPRVRDGEAVELVRLRPQRLG